MLANLLQAEGDIYEGLGKNDESAMRRLKALDIQLGILTNEDPASTRAADSVRTLLNHLEDYELSIRTKILLWRHFEQYGDFARAEDWMYEAMEDDTAPPDMSQRAIAFYHRLLDQSDFDLVHGNLPRTEVEAGLAQVESGHTGGQPVG